MISSHIRPSLTPASAARVVAAPRQAAVNPNQRQPWYGETMPMGLVVAAINRNNDRVPTLWARHDYDADIVIWDPDESFIVAYRSAEEMPLGEVEQTAVRASTQQEVEQTAVRASTQQ